MKIDDVETTEKYKKIEKELDEKIRKILKSEKIDENELGYCYYYWDLKKQILKYDYNIEWESPSELNPEIIFD